MKYVIAALGGKQFKLSEQDVFELPANTALKPEILMYSDGKEVYLDKDALKDVKLQIEVIRTANAKKVQVKRFKAKSRYRKNKGHKQPIIVLSVTSIKYKDTETAEKPAVTEGKKEKKAPSKVVAAKSTEKKPKKIIKEVKSEVPKKKSSKLEVKK